MSLLRAKVARGLVCDDPVVAIGCDFAELAGGEIPVVDDLIGFDQGLLVESRRNAAHCGAL